MAYQLTNWLSSYKLVGPLSIIQSLSEVVPFKIWAKWFESWPNSLEASWMVYKQPKWHKSCTSLLNKTAHSPNDMKACQTITKACTKKQGSLASRTVQPMPAQIEWWKPSELVLVGSYMLRPYAQGEVVLCMHGPAFWPHMRLIDPVFNFLYAWPV